MSMYFDKVKFLKAQNYTNFNPSNMTIYCDPPYKDNNVQSEHFNNFDHNEFWDLMRKWAKNNLVLISEYTAPKDFEIVWEKQMGTCYHKKPKVNTEKIFMYKYGI